jgi:hypothetical protein
MKGLGELEDWWWECWRRMKGMQWGDLSSVKVGFGVVMVVEKRIDALDSTLVQPSIARGGVGSSFLGVNGVEILMRGRSRCRINYARCVNWATKVEGGHWRLMPKNCEAHCEINSLRLRMES